MNWNFFSFFLNNEEPFLQLNTNILETNLLRKIQNHLVMHQNLKEVKKISRT
jgi:hypothetical protein